MGSKLQLSISLILLLFAYKEVACQNLAVCQNNGTPLNSTLCQCPSFVAGSNCDIIKCQRWGIPDRNRCACAPGWYDKYCGIRGCRPPNEDNLDLNKRSLIIVFNAKTTMRSQLDTLINSFESMVNSMTTKYMTTTTENWIENIIIYSFVQKSNKLTSKQVIVKTVNHAVNFLKSIELLDGDANQPVLTALKTAQQTFPEMKSHSVVLVFTDSPASDATPWSHRFEDKNTEQIALQISFLWRSKVSFILSIPDGYDPSSDGIDVYHRLSMTNHGDYFFVKEQNQTKKILENVIGTYYFPENIAVGYGASGSQVIVPTPDNENDVVFVLITIDPRTASSSDFPMVTNGGMPASGPNYRLYVFSQVPFINITSGINSLYNFRVYLQSKNSVLFDYNSDMMIDVGNGIVHLGVVMTSTIRTFGFPPGKNNSYHVNSPTNQLLREKYYAYQRPQQDCTFKYGFPPWIDTNSCVPGPITQVHTLYYEGYNKIRVSPGYCDQIAHYTHKQQGYVIPELEAVEQLEKRSKFAITPLISCDKMNIDAINDPRLTPAKQFIFILEQHPGNKAVYQTLASEINEIIDYTRKNKIDSYENEYTLMIHCNQETHVLLSTYNPDVFVQKFRSLVNSIGYVDNLDNTLGLLSIVQAQKLNIQPTSQVYYFTNQAVKTVQSIDRKWDIVNRDIEFNFFTIADGKTTEIFALPSELELVQKMSNGRIIPLRNDQKTIKNIFGDMVSMNTLTTDNEKYDCHSAPFEVEAFIEDGALATVIQFVGTGLQKITLRDSTGFQFDITNYVSFLSDNFISLNIQSFQNPFQLSTGIWIINVSTTSGGCQVNVRQQSNIGVVLGFSGSDTNDFVDSQIPSQRTDLNQSIFVPIRFLQPSSAQKIVPSTLTIEVVNRKRYDTPTLHLSTDILRKDEETCSYAFSTTRIPMPKSDLSFWTFRAIANGGVAIVRRFYYYQHIPADVSVCHGGQVDQYGQCICPTRYTGEYCWDRICAPGATLSFGICSCSSGFYGDFCELELMMPNSTNPISTISPGSSTIQTTTSVSNITTVSPGSSTIQTTTSVSNIKSIFSALIILFMSLHF